MQILPTRPYRLFSANLSMASQSSDLPDLNVARDITEISINRNIMNNGAYFTVKFVSNSFTFIPPQSILTIIISDYTKGETPVNFGLIGIISGGDGVLPVNNPGDTAPSESDAIPMEWTFVDIWSVLATTELIEFSLEDTTMADCLIKIKDAVAAIPATLSLLAKDTDLDSDMTEPDNSSSYENIFIPGLSYIEALKSLNRNYGIYNSSMFIYSESIVKELDKINRTSIITSINHIVKGQSRNQIYINIGDPVTDNTTRDASTPSYTIYNNAFKWNVNAVMSLSKPMIMSYQFAGADVFWNNSFKTAADDGEEFGTELDYFLRVQKVGKEFAPERTETSLRSRFDQTIPWISITVHPPLWNWSDFRPTTRAIVTYTEKLNKVESEVINGNWCVAQNLVTFSVEGLNMRVTKNEVNLIKHYTKQSKLKANKIFDSNNNNDIA